MKLIQVDINGQIVSGYAQKIKGDLWVHFFGKTIKVPYSNSETTNRRRRSEGKSSSDRVVAPMPGKITKILVNLDQSVATGETVLVMEAMKMEYTLKAEIDAKISKLNCQVGDQVQLGDELIHLEPVNEVNDSK